MRHGGVEKRQAEQLGKERQQHAEEDRQQDEGRPQEAAHDRPDTADDDHEQDLERHFQREAVRLDRAEVAEGVPATPQVEGADGKGEQLARHQRDVDHRGGHVQRRGTADPGAGHRRAQRRWPPAPAARRRCSAPAGTSRPAY